MTALLQHVDQPFGLGRTDVGILLAEGDENRRPDPFDSVDRRERPEGLSVVGSIDFDQTNLSRKLCSRKLRREQDVEMQRAEEIRGIPE